MSDSLDTMIAEVLRFELDPSMDFLDLTAFQGFDPVEVFKKIAPKLKDANSRKLLQFIIAFGLTRGFGGGKSISQLLERTGSAAGKQMLRDAVSLFNIVQTTSKTKDDVTIDRVMGAFPALTHKLWVKICSDDRCPDKVEDYEGQLPAQFQYPGSPAAMNAKSKEKFFGEYLDWMQTLQAVWGRNGNTRGGTQQRDVVEKFALLQFGTRLYPMKTRPNYNIA